MTSLRWLSLENTAVSDAGLATLKAMSFLKQLRLKGTAASNAGVQELKRVLPNVEISDEAQLAARLGLSRPSSR